MLGVINMEKWEGFIEREKKEINSAKAYSLK